MNLAKWKKSKPVERVNEKLLKIGQVLCADKSMYTLFVYYTYEYVYDIYS